MAYQIGGYLNKGGSRQKNPECDSQRICCVFCILAWQVLIKLKMSSYTGVRIGDDGVDQKENGTSLWF